MIGVKESNDHVIFDLIDKSTDLKSSDGWRHEPMIKIERSTTERRYAMTFYFTIPSGNVSLSRLEQFAMERLQFLIQLAACKGDVIQATDLCMQLQHVEHSECLIQGTLKDKISHFVLRLASCTDAGMADVIFYAETQLFAFRLSCMTKEEKLAFLTSLSKHMKGRDLESVKHTTTRGALAVLANILHQMSLTELADTWDEGRTDRTISVPFLFALSLVAKRKVNLHRGWAEVPYCMLNDIFQSVFSYLLQSATKKAKKQMTLMMEDDRFNKLFHKLKDVFLSYSSKQNCGISCTKVPLRCEDVDAETDFFPPCMRHLHQQLRQRHRLSHHSRVKYTLFQKECGLPVHEALRFWREEYSQEPHHSAGCRHNWREERDRYTYNIRHLYGLEGARKNYRGHDCDTIQKQQPGPNEEWGCPFQHFDQAKLSEIMDIEDISQTFQSRISHLSEHGDPNAACKVYFLAKLKKMADRNCIETDLKTCDCHCNETRQRISAGCKWTCEDTRTLTDVTEVKRDQLNIGEKKKIVPKQISCSNCRILCNRTPFDKVPLQEFHKPHEYYQNFKFLFEGLTSVRDNNVDVESTF
ncbi:DNA primase large subunit isoform X1 [Lingula anatina]|uniref:DNA primase large subunit isoform X1 n=2 Tax=Lingula anatina TaxID=7574 RepID=A0A1S3KFD9_LINAN|nr:DNA primase large subunit isoform X1 [Lingula anatina]|eukprot:XP_013421355.1 DNA primase large subunit isoform X1 [Lingula anatina]